MTTRPQGYATGHATGQTAAPRDGWVHAGAIARDEGAQRRRLSWMFGLVVAVAAGLSILWPDHSARELTAHRRTSLHAVADAFSALHDLLLRLGYHVDRLRASYAKLPPPPTALIVCLDPLPYAELAKVYDGLEIGQVSLLRQWVRDGGHLMVTWPSAQRDKDQSTRPADKPGRDDVIGALCEPFPESMPETRWIEHKGMLRGVGELQAIAQPWRPFTATDLELVEAHVQRNQAGEPPQMQAFVTPLPAGWRGLVWLDGAALVIERHVGRGVVWAASSALLFSTLALARQDVGPPLVALLHIACEEGRRRVVFDEFAHGQREARGMGWFVRHGPLGYPVAAALLLLVVLAWRGAVRLGPPLPEPTVPRRAKEEFVIGMAALEQRAGHARAAGQAVLRAQQNSARGDPERSADLAQLAASLDSGRPFCDNDLVALVADIDAIDRRKPSS